MRWRPGESGLWFRYDVGRLIMTAGHWLTHAVEWHELRCDAYGERSRLTEATNAIWSYGFRLAMDASKKLS